MSLYDKASLVQIPSGTKSGTLYSVLPANGDGDFDHTRATSATRVNKDGLIESVASGVPRLDYPLIDGVVQDCPALLLEPSRGNAITYSEDFSDSSWNKNNVSITSNSIVSPDGSVNASLMTIIGGSSDQRVDKNVAYTGQNVFSVFAKANDSKWLSLRVGAAANKWFDLENGVLGGSTITTDLDDSFIEYYGNGWYRCGIIFTNSSTLNTKIYPAENDRDITHTSGSVYIWGAQAEAGSYPTSYIPTTSSTVTRNADECNGAGTSAEFNDSEGVLFAEISALENDGTIRRISINDNVFDNDRVLIGYSGTDNQIQGQSRTGTSTQAALDYTVPDATIPNKVAMKYKANDFALWVNGFEVDTDISGTAPEGLIRLSFDRGATQDFYGNTKQLMAFNEALTDSELEQVTSWTSFGEMAKGQLYTIE